VPQAISAEHANHINSIKICWLDQGLPATFYLNLIMYLNFEILGNLLINLHIFAFPQDTQNFINLRQVSFHLSTNTPLNLTLANAERTEIRLFKCLFLSHNYSYYLSMISFRVLRLTISRIKTYIPKARCKSIINCKSLKDV